MLLYFNWVVFLPWMKSIGSSDYFKYSIIIDYMLSSHFLPDGFSPWINFTRAAKIGWSVDGTKDLDFSLSFCHHLKLILILHPRYWNPNCTTIPLSLFKKYWLASFLKERRHWECLMQCYYNTSVLPIWLLTLNYLYECVSNPEYFCQRENRNQINLYIFTQSIIPRC